VNARRVALVLLMIVVATGVLLVLLAHPATGPGGLSGAATAVTPPAAQHHPPPKTDYAVKFAPPAEQVRAKLKLGLRSGLLFDVRSGRVLWERAPGRRLPIASLTKMMTALVAAGHAKLSAKALITRQAVHFTGSGVGLLPVGKRVPLGALLYGLLLPSGNDAAIALAQHVGHTQTHFISMMNARAQTMGLRCSHFSTVSGVVDRGNYSCATDLAALAHAMLMQPFLAKIVGSRSAIVPFPIKGGKLFLYNNNPLLIVRYPGTDGVKTGFTDASGPCLVATARRGRAWLGVVLLHSGNPSGQAQQLLNAGFAKFQPT
jgi:D-alanyl-D-alanine carboxypeptidase (penicillin-binding protein 5/6)